MRSSDHSPLFRGKQFLYDGGIHIPLLVRFPDARMAGTVDDRFVSAVRTKEFKYIRNYYPAIPYMQHNPYKEREYPTWNLVKEWAGAGKLNREQGLFAAAVKPMEELYDLRADPDEVHNLALEPGRQSDVAGAARVGGRVYP